MKSGTVGKTGFLRIGFEHRGSHTILANIDPCALHGAARAILRRGNAGLGLCILDQHHWLASAGRPARARRHGRFSAQAHVTTQSATKSHTMDANYAARRATPWMRCFSVNSQVAAAFGVVRNRAATRVRQPRRLSPATQALGRETDFLENPGPRWVGGGETLVMASYLVIEGGLSEARRYGFLARTLRTSSFLLPSSDWSTGYAQCEERPK
jgi:hypothetical protein